MDKENGKNNEGNSGSSKISNTPDNAALLDAASLFGAYWPRGDAGNAASQAANLFAAAGGGFGLPHPSLSFGMLPPGAAAGRGMSAYPATSAYNNAYTNTLSVAASQAASLGIPAASAAWWSMASHLAAQDYLARLQASGISFPGIGNPADPYAAALGLSSLTGHHKSPKNSKSSSSLKSQGGSKDKSLSSSQSASKLDSRVEQALKASCNSKSSGGGGYNKYSSPSLTIQPTMKLPSEKKHPKVNDLAGYKSVKSSASGSSGGGSSSGKVTAAATPPPPHSTSSIFASPLSLASNSSDKGSASGVAGGCSQNSIGGGASGIPASILSDQNSILGGVRLPPDTEIIKYTSSIVGPKVPGTTNRGRKKTISLDPPSDLEEGYSPPTISNDRVEVIKLPATNGSPSGITVPSYGGETTARRKPGPKPRRVIPSGSQLPPSSSSSLNQLFASADSPRPPSRNEGSDGGSSTSSTSASMPAVVSSSASTTVCSISSLQNHKEGRPRNLGRGVSKPKKNTVASLLAQSRALGIKPMPMLDPNASMNQQMNILKSNILAAQQYISEAGGDEKALNKFLQEKFRGTLSDSSTVDASTDSDNLTDSNHTDSEMEAEVAPKKQKQYDERALRVPLEKGWKRETIIRGLTKNGGIKGDVTYNAPDSTNKFKQMSDITQYLEYQKNMELTRENFTFSCRVILGDYLQPVPPEMAADGSEYIHLTEDDINKRLDELKTAMRTSLPVEQRIEMARKQQAARVAARLDREQARLAKEIERSERQEAARRDREVKSQQMLEAKRKRQEEMEKHRQEEQQRKQQEREMKRQQAAILKEQERERRRQHMALIKALESRRKLEERERKKQQLLAEKQANKEKKLEQRKMEMEILAEIRKPCEDLELDQRPLPEYERIPGLRLPGKAFADILMVFEFLHNFGETLGFDMDSLPTLDSLQQALMPNENSSEAEEELFSVMTHLLVCAIEDPGIPNPARHTTILGQSLRQADITHSNLSEILRIYLYANATGEVKALTGVHFERDREKRVADHHQNDNEMLQTQSGKNSQYYELLHDNSTWKMSDLLKDKPFMALSPTDKASILAFICNELLQNKAVLKQIENSLENVAQLRKEKWLLDTKIRKLRMLHSRKVRAEAAEKSQSKADTDGAESTVDSPALHKDDLMDDEDNDMSENESVGTQPEEEEDSKLSSEELGKKLEKLVKASEQQLQSLNASTQQLRATSFGQDRYWRRYWSLPKAGGIYVEAMESADPDILLEQIEFDKKSQDCANNLDDISKIITNSDPVNDMKADREVSSIVGSKEEPSFTQVDEAKVNNNETDHRKTVDRLDVENGEILDKSERNLAELQKSVDNIVQSLERSIELDKQQTRIKEESQEDKVHNHVEDGAEKKPFAGGYTEPLASKKFNLFEKLGQCMERENKSEADLKAEVKAEVKEELKNEILKELKLDMRTVDIKSEVKQEVVDEKMQDGEQKWFSVLNKEDITCEGVHLTAGNKWDNGVGACTRDNLTELKIPVFPPPSANSTAYHASCDSPAPLQMSAEENAQLQYIKKHGMPKACERKSVPGDKRHGWWRIVDEELLRTVLESLHIRGARERELKRNFINIMQAMYERQGKVHIEEGNKELTEFLSDNGTEDVKYVAGGAPAPDEPGAWNHSVAYRVDLFLLDQLEALEDKVASASMQIKGWKIPSHDGPEIPVGEVVDVVKERLTSLEQNIERRYLKPPLGVNTGDPNLAAIAQEASNSGGGGSGGGGNSGGGGGGGSTTQTSQSLQQSSDDVPKGLANWREAIHRSQTSAQLAMCLYALESSIAWDKSIMKANCQFCQSGDNEDKLLLCDGCDKGYHTYCFRPKMENIPEGDWYCHECMNKATGERNCIVCGKKQSTTGMKLILCELCPRAYHTDCIQPTMNKVPRGKWYCSNCISKKPPKKSNKKNHSSKVTRDSESSDHPPSSPAPSHSSVTTNEDQPTTTTNCNQSDVSNSSLANATSPSTHQQQAAAAAAAAIKKDRVSKKLLKELGPCKTILEELECHDDAWPFLLPVNTKQFPTYRKIIKSPMDLSTIKRRLQDMHYKTKEEFCADVRQIFNNCEIFNEDDSPVGKAGHCMRQFFEAKWNELCAPHAHS